MGGCPASGRGAGPGTPIARRCSAPSPGSGSSTWPGALRRALRRAAAADAIARALAANPELLVVDEPTNGMDPAAELATMDLLKDLHEGGKRAIVMVSHRLEAVANYARSLAFVDKASGSSASGGIDEMLHPEALGALYGRP